MPISKRILTNENIAIKKCKHGYFAYYVNDLFVGKSLDEYGEWTENEFITLDSLIFPGNVVIDVGAYIGTHSVFFGKKVGPSGVVYSLEPQRNIYYLLCANAAINNLLNIRCLNVAASDKNSTTNIPVLDPKAKQNFGAFNIYNFGQNGDPVEVVTIDSLNLPKCNLIKVDVEGMQDKVIKGATETIKKFKPVLYVENNVAEKSYNTLKILSKIGYQGYWHILPCYNKDNYFKNKNNVFDQYQVEVNMLCFPKEAKPKLVGFIKAVGLNDNWIKALERSKIS